MARPLSPPPEFDDRSPWGTYRPTAAIALRLALAHRLPPFLKQTALALRKPVKYGLDTPLDLDIRGLKLRLLPRGNISEEKFYTAPHLFDPEEFALMDRRLKPGNVFLDIGANAGIYSFHAHRCMQGRGRILAIEPDPEMGRRIAFNLRTNTLADIELVPVALSDRDGTAEFYVNPNQRGTNTLLAGKSDPKSGERITVSVPVRTLLSLLQERRIERIDMLKIDVEGHEHAVLGHFLAAAPVSLLPRVIISEFKNHAAGGTPDLLQAAGYRLGKATRLNFIFERT
ncbi:FkbM family methyltransferase [Rhizobium sp. TRM95111]|uniref:FkbM family methyltransferase n=1 Tax=Rhizobium alarense TaxID=2846851 RepID=UPI001F23EB1A|nr:FkbM family methyltransferase [Rhizobium alarense]MCF3642346.1 FkbM family methyltransferase [Rhizobium alarense]